MKAKRRASTSLSQHPTKGFRLQIGSYFTPEGKRSGKVWWFGRIDPREAEFQASLIKQVFAQACPDGIWTTEATDWAKKGLSRARAVYKHRLATATGTLVNAGMVVSPGPTPSPVAARAARAEAPKGPTTLHRAIDAYLVSLKGKAKSNSHKDAADQVLNVRVKKACPDRPLDEIDFSWIDCTCDHFKARPLLKGGKRRMSPSTVVHTLKYLRLLLTWMDDTEYGGWQAPRKFLKPFRVTETDLMTPVELRKASTIPQFDPATLRKLYQGASDRVRAWMLMALFTGALQTELSVLERSEFDLDGSVLNHFRNKTRVDGRYWLPPELVTLLKAQFAVRPEDTLAFVTQDGTPLVSFKDGKKTSDAVRVAWNRLRKAAEVPDALPFKYLRKYLGDWMKRRGGIAMGQVALSQRDGTVLSRHYSSATDFDRFIELQKQMYAELRAAKMFDPFTPEEIEQERAAQRERVARTAA